MNANPLLREREVEFLLYELVDVERLCRLPDFSEHSRATFDVFVDQARRIARDVLFPAYRAMDESPPRLTGGRVVVHAKMHDIYRQLVSLGLVAAARPAAVGGQQVPLAVTTFAHAY